MGKVISVASQKGGVGKSTTTTLLANFFFFHFGLSIAIIDADYAQFSISKRREDELKVLPKSKKLQSAYELLYTDRKPYHIVRTKLKNLDTVLDEIIDQYDYIFLDLAGTMYQPGIFNAYRKINHFLIPVAKDNFSLKSAIEFYQVITRKIKPKSVFESCFLFFNRVPRRHKVHKMLPLLMKKLPFMPIYMSEYLIYETAYRSTLFPIPKAKMEAVKMMDFAKLVLANIQNTPPHAEHTQIEHIQTDNTKSVNT